MCKLTLALLVVSMCTVGYYFWSGEKTDLNITNAVTREHKNMPYTFVVVPPEATLLDADVETIFALVEAARRDYNAQDSVPAYRHAKELSDYVYQLVVDGKNISVYGLPSKQMENPVWATAAIDVADGGADYFEAIVNLESNTVTDFYVHGEA